MVMRAVVLAGILALTMTAGAKPIGTASDVPFFLKLPSDAHLSASYARQSDQQSDNASWRQADAQDRPAGVSFGPIHAEAVTDDRPGGKHKTVMQYRVDGMQVFGGSVGGHLGGHGAMLTLHWH